ncbi:MAG: hypothetical protein GEU75_07995 [Dehalococcoidia bacterium]|nr:hypothetical protein [Dehalococcoidia bacterium]
MDDPTISTEAAVTFGRTRDMSPADSDKARRGFTSTDSDLASAAENSSGPSIGEEFRQSYGSEHESKGSPTAPEKCSNVIASGTKWEGSLISEDSVRVEGRLKGTVDAKGTIHISEGAVVEAKIKATFVVICGTFKGEIRCLERLELQPQSKIEGEVITKALHVHEGALVNGTIRMSTDKPGESSKDSNDGEGKSRTVALNGTHSGRASTEIA